MITNDAMLLKEKHELLYEVAKHAFIGDLEEKIEILPYELYPGPNPKSRCCVYREREVARQRINLAVGKNPNGSKDHDGVVQIIPSACEGCPISRYVVTDNCQNCMGKACINSCKFGAISQGLNHTYIDPQKCKECGQCAKNCPYNAIADLMRPCKRSCPVDALRVEEESGIAIIDKTKCIECGHCIHACPFGAIGSKTYIVDVIKAIKEGKHVYAMLAPAAEGQFGADITMRSWAEACKKVGFTEFYEVGLGGDMTANAEADEWVEAYKEGEKKTTSCCPAFVNMIQRQYPDLISKMSTAASPMTLVSRMIKSDDPESVTVFIGPCVAKKAECGFEDVPDGADFALTFGEIRAIFRAKGVELEPAPNDLQQASVFGKRFGNSAGVTQAVLKVMDEKGIDTSNIKVAVCNGAAECKKALALLKAGRLPEDFIEGMICEGGCVGGASKHRTELESKRSRDTLIGQAENRNIGENLTNQVKVSYKKHRK